MFKQGVKNLLSLKNNSLRLFKFGSTNNFFSRLPKFSFCSTVNPQSDINISSIHNRTSEISLYEPLTVNSLRDNKGARTPKTRWGRGPGSGKGKTCGRGHKGYKARVGNVSRHFEGGQTPITRRLPKHGFRKLGCRENYNYINLDRIIYLILKGRLDPSNKITIRELFWSGGISKMKKGLKLLSRGSENLKDLPPLHIEVSSASQRAIEEIKSCGGMVTCVHHTPLTLQYQCKPWKFIRKPMDPIPKFKKVIKLLNQEEKGAK